MKCRSGKGARPDRDTLEIYLESEPPETRQRFHHLYSERNTFRCSMTQSRQEDALRVGIPDQKHRVRGPNGSSSSRKEGGRRTADWISPKDSRKGQTF